jgi:AraC-like DNA-binding protein
MKAIELLVAGNSVKETAYRVGYRQTGAFVTMFRDTFGKTPKAWVSGLTNHAENRLHENAARAPH